MVWTGRAPADGGGQRRWLQARLWGRQLDRRPAAAAAAAAGGGIGGAGAGHTAAQAAAALRCRPAALSSQQRGAGKGWFAVPGALLNTGRSAGAARGPAHDSSGAQRASIAACGACQRAVRHWQRAGSTRHPPAPCKLFAGGLVQRMGGGSRWQSLGAPRQRGRPPRRLRHPPRHLLALRPHSLRPLQRPMPAWSSLGHDGELELGGAPPIGACAARAPALLP